MNYNEPDNKTTQIPSFLRGAMTPEPEDKPGGGTMSEQKPEEEPSPKKIEEPVKEKILTKKEDLTLNNKKKKDKLPKNVHILSYIVAIVFVLYICINFIWALTGGPSGSDTASKPDVPATVEESATPVETVTPGVTVVPEMPAETGSITVLAEMIIKRTEPSLNAMAAGAVYAGETYTVSETQEADGYTWYQIDDGTWIASDGSWVDYITR